MNAFFINFPVFFNTASRMDEVFKKLYREWNVLFDEKSDQRTKDLFLMSSPFHVLLISIAYLILVKVR